MLTELTVIFLGYGALLVLGLAGGRFINHEARRPLVNTASISAILMAPLLIMQLKMVFEARSELKEIPDIGWSFLAPAIVMYVVAAALGVWEWRRLQARRVPPVPTPETPAPSDPAAGA